MLFSLEKKHFRAFNLILVILLGISLGYFFSAASSLYLDRQEPHVKLSDNQEDIKPRHTSLQSYQSILKLNLFDPANRHQADSALSQDRLQKKPSTATQRKDLTLVGTVTSSENPFAVIQAGGEEHIVHLKEELPDGEELERISREEIWLRGTDGTLFPLALPKAAASEPETQPESSSRQPQAEGIKKIGENRWIISNQEARNARGNIGVLMQQARFEPRLNNGQVEGFAVRMIRPRSLLWNLGLKRGDVVKEINGVQLDSPEKGLEILNQLQEARNISVGLQRRGKNLTFEYEIE